MIVFGPIPSRRLGRSLGINNIPYKHCSYSCVYCQLGPTNAMTSACSEFFSPDQVFDAVKLRIEELKTAGETIDYLTFVSDGEPTLDSQLGASINKLKPLGYKIAVITNSSLLSLVSVRNALLCADWVSLKVDAASSTVWRKINRPHGSLDLKEIENGMTSFASRFTGALVTETMLVKDMNDTVSSIRETAEIIRRLNPRTSYILIPTRPPAVESVVPAEASAVTAAYQIFKEFNLDTELVLNAESDQFTCCSDTESELLNILSVHPMRKDAVITFLSRSHSGWDVIERLIKESTVKEVNYNNELFIVRTFGSSSIS